MDSFEMNKVIGAILATVFVVFSIGIISDALFSEHAPETPGYAIAAAEPEAGGEAEGGEAAPAEPVLPLIASADPAAGEALFKRCAACHTVEQGGANKIGPNLWNVVNRPIASHEGYAYSAAMKEFSQGGSVVWDYEQLAAFLHAPKAHIRGTAMNFPGLKKPEDLAGVISYLRTLSESPAPPPAAEAAAPAAPAAPGTAPAGEEAPSAQSPTGPAAPPAGEAPAGQAPAPAEGGTAPAAGGAAPAPGRAPAGGAAAPAAGGAASGAATPDTSSGDLPAGDPSDDILKQEQAPSVTDQ